MTSNSECMLINCSTLWRPNPILDGSDAVAVGAMMVCLASGIDIPNEIAIAGFGGFEIASALAIPLTTIRSPRYEMGRVSAELVLERLAGDGNHQHVVPAFEIVAGDSA